MSDSIMNQSLGLRLVKYSMSNSCLTPDTASPYASTHRQHRLHHNTWIILTSTCRVVRLADNLGSVYMLVHCLLVVFCTLTTLHCFLAVVMDSRNLLMESNGILNLTLRKVRLQLLVVTPLLCPSNWVTLPWLGSAMWSILAAIF